MEKKQTFPEYLKQLRKSCHYKQDFVATNLHISRQTYSHYETGRIKPSVGVLYRMSKFYGVSVEDIFEHMDVCPSRLADKEEEKGNREKDDFTEREFFYYYHNLNEKNKEDILSIMKAIMQTEN